MKLMTQDEVLAKFKKKHGTTFDYNEVEYKRSNKPVTIICKVHGPFKQKPCDHIYGSGCPSCGHRKGESKGTKTPKVAKTPKVKTLKVARVASTEKFVITPEGEARILHFMESTGCNRGAALKRVKREEAKTAK